MEKFHFEDLEVWQKAVNFADKIIDIVDRIDDDRKHYRLFEQMESAAASISQNIAEGKGRYTSKEMIHFYRIARGSLYEVATLLTIFFKRNWIAEKDHIFLKLEALTIGKMINGLINSLTKIPSTKSLNPKPYS